jgi:bifunctional ADP-heptose synthase (sugar kinase/adenylyltransferase)
MALNAYYDGIIPLVDGYSTTKVVKKIRKKK